MKNLIVLKIIFYYAWLSFIGCSESDVVKGGCDLQCEFNKEYQLVRPVKMYREECLDGLGNNLEFDQWYIRTGSTGVLLPVSFTGVGYYRQLSSGEIPVDTTGFVNLVGSYEAQFEIAMLGEGKQLSLKEFSVSVHIGNKK